MAVLVPTGTRPRRVTLARHPVPIVVGKGSLVPVAMLACLFALYSSGASALVLVGAAALGGLGGGASLIVHELGHVRAARRIKGIRPVRISLIWVGAGTKFEGAYRSGRDQARVALGGPAASCVLAMLLLAIALLPMPRAVQLGIFGLAILNLAIAIFSLIPVHPLDGHKALVGFLWRRSRSERQAKAILRRAGGLWLALEGLASIVLVVEKPVLGSLLVVSGALLLLQKRVSGTRGTPRRASFRATAPPRSL